MCGLSVKIVIRGDRNTGKSTLWHRLQGKKFQEEYIPTQEIQVTSIHWSYKSKLDVFNENQSFCHFSVIEIFLLALLKIISGIDGYIPKNGSLKVFWRTKCLFYGITAEKKLNF